MPKDIFDPEFVNLIKMEEVRDRIIEILKDELKDKFNEKGFEEKYSISMHPNYFRYLFISRKTKLTGTMIIVIANRLKKSVDYLLYGEKQEEKGETKESNINTFYNCTVIYNTKDEGELKCQVSKN